MLKIKQTNQFKKDVKLAKKRNKKIEKLKKVMKLIVLQEELPPKYKNHKLSGIYKGCLEYDDEAKIFHGEVIGLKDVITFQGTTVDEIEKAFKDSIDDYLDWCKERGEKPEKPYSGKFNLRIPPELHAQLVAHSELEHASLNAYITDTLQKAING